MKGIAELLQSIFCGIISGFAILPITSDAIRNVLFGRKKRALQSAKRELLETIEGMLLSGQSIGDITYGALMSSAAIRYNIDCKLLGSKEENMAVVLQTINSSKIVPSYMKRLVSDHIQKQIEDKQDKSEDIRDSTNEFDSYNFDRFEFDETSKSKTEYEQYTNSPFINKIQIFFALGVGILTAVSVYVVNMDNISSIIICLSAIFVCINILTLLIDAAKFPTAETIKQLVYKVAFIIVLICFLLISVLFKKNLN